MHMFKKKDLIVRGFDLKLLISSNKGVMIFKGDKLMFVPYEDPITLSLTGLNTKAKEPVVFISEEFEKLNALEDDKKYVLDFKCGALEIWDEKHENLIMAIMGITV